MRKFEGDELVLASHNNGKIVEFSRILAPLGVEVLSAGDVDLEEPEETETTFEGNALLKAHFAAKATGKICLADDSGLVVDAMDGAPGVYSARYAINETGERDFNYAMLKVLDELRGERDNRKAAFVAVLALAWPDGHAEVFEGRVEGTIAHQITGDQGFGYDPIFIPEGENRTFGQMSAEEKKALSHRGRAVEKLFNACFPKLV